MTQSPQSYRGKLLIVGMFLMATCFGLGSLIYRYVQTRDVLRLCGAEAAKSIAKQDKIEALRLEPAATDADLHVGDQGLKIVQTRDVTKTPGFTNARNALVLDRSFELSPATACKPTWTYALRFTRDKHQTVVLLSLDCPRALLHGTDHSAGIQPIVKGLKTLLEENLPVEKK